jgi:hypothetical protein
MDKLSTKWVMTHSDASSVRARVDEYEKRLHTNMTCTVNQARFSQDKRISDDVFGDVSAMKERIEAILNRLSTDSDDDDDDLMLLVHSILDGTAGDGDPGDSLPMSVAAVQSLAEPVHVQCRLANKLILDMFQTPQQSMPWRWIVCC